MKTLFNRFTSVFVATILVFGILVGCAVEDNHSEASTNKELNEKGWTYPGDTISEEFIFTGISGRFNDWGDRYPYGLTFVNKTHNMTIPYYFLAEDRDTLRLSPPNSNSGFIVTVKEIDSVNNRVKLTVKEIE